MNERASREPRVQSSVWSFLKAFAVAPRTIGAIAPTSHGVARRITELAEVESARLVAELGAGTGAITEELLRAMPEDGRLWAFEIHPPFVDDLRRAFDDPRLAVVTESAEQIVELRRREDLPPFDAVVSALPFSMMGPQATRQVLEAVTQVLNPDGVFVALQYHPRFLPPHLRAHFERVEQRRYLWNVPPANLLRASAPRRGG